MGITEMGIRGEREALAVLKRHGFDCFQPDWIAKKDGKYIVVEVKHKELFQPPPFLGTGLEIYQVKARMNFYRDTRIRVVLLIFYNNDIYYQWLDVLEKGQYFDTKNGIRIYPIENYLKDITDNDP